MGFHIVKICSNAQKRKTSILYTGIQIILISVNIVLGQNNFYRVNSCTDITLAEIPIEVYQRCIEKDKVIHCLPDDDDVLGLSCFSITWIAKGRCPYYNKYQGNLDEKACTGDANLCPPALFKSPLSVLYKGCYIKEITTTRATPTIATTSSTIATTSHPMSTGNITSNRSTHASMCPTSRTICNEAISEETSCSTKTGLMIFFLITTIIFPLGLLVLVVRGYSKLCRPCRDKARICRKGHSKDEEKEEKEIMEPLKPLNDKALANGGQHVPTEDSREEGLAKGMHT